MSESPIQVSTGAEAYSESSQTWDKGFKNGPSKIAWADQIF